MNLALSCSTSMAQDRNESIIGKVFLSAYKLKSQNINFTDLVVSIELVGITRKISKLCYFASTPK